MPQLKTAKPAGPRSTVPYFTCFKGCFNDIVYVSLQLYVQNVVSAQPCVGKFRISLVLLNFLHCNFRLWFKTP